MKKLSFIKHYLLFVFCSLCILSTYAQLNPLGEIDMTIPAPPPVVKKHDPKDSFKELFEQSAATKSKFSSFRGIKTEYLNPKVYSFVQDYIERNADDLIALQSWGRPYFDMMDNVLTENGIPKQLKYLAVIESNLKANAVSWVGAVGPWQFMPGTARGLGLVVNDYNDERRDYLKSTRAATKYLNYLFGLYHDWLLVVAAYNCGPGRVNSAIQRSGSNDFWDLQYYLPAESRTHVKKFIATHYIMEGQGGVATVSRDQAIAMMGTVKDRVTNKDLKIQPISGRYNSKAIAKYLEMTLAEFNRLNPSLDKVLASNNTYQLKLPLDKVDLFLNKKNEMLNESIQMLINPMYRN